MKYAHGCALIQSIRVLGKFKVLQDSDDLDQCKSADGMGLHLYGLTLRYLYNIFGDLSINFHGHVRQAVRTVEKFFHEAMVHRRKGFKVPFVIASMILSPI